MRWATYLGAVIVTALVAGVAVAAALALVALPVLIVLHRRAASGPQDSD